MQNLTFVSVQSFLWQTFWIVILGAFAKLRKATISFVMSVRPTFRVEKLGSHGTDFRKI
jgi:hypothetical protein